MKEPQTIKAKKVGKYVVLSNGEVWNMRFNGKNGNIKKVKQTKHHSGYLYFNFNGKTIQAHRLITECFLPNPNNLPEVNHKDENPLNNHVVNLEWCDRKYNVNYGTHNERMVKTQTNDPKKSKPVCQYTKNGQFIAEYPSLHEVERQLGYFNSRISDCCNGKQKSAYGHLWRWKSTQPTT